MKEENRKNEKIAKIAQYENRSQMIDDVTVCISIADWRLQWRLNLRPEWRPTLRILIENDR